MSEKLNVELSGDSSKLEKATAKASRSLQNFEKVADKSVGGISKPTVKASKALVGLNKDSGRVSNTLLEFNRVVQDAPFGIQGVANNITQLTQNFGYLKQSTGSTKAALKSLLAGFAGPAGILFVISLATSLLVTYGDKLFNSKSDTDKLAEATKKASEALQKFVENQSAANRALIKGQQNAQSEIITLGQLRDVVEDTARSTEDRQKAIQELRRLFPSYFKDLSDEKILTGDLSAVYDQLTTSIIKRAKATAATNILVKNAEKEIAITARLSQITDEILKSKTEIERIDKLNVGNRSGGQVGGFSQIGESLKQSNLLEEGEKLRKELEQILGASLDLSQIINDNGGIDLSKVKLKGGEQTNAPLLKVAPQIQFETKGIDTSGVQDLTDAIIAPLNKLNISQKMSDLEFELRAAAIRFNQNASALIEDSIAGTFQNIGASIGEAISSGGNIIEAAGRGIIAGLGGFLSDLGGMLIKYGTLAVIKGKLDLAILSGGPVAIGAGIAAIAVGVALSAAGSALGNAARGGSTSGGFSSGGSSRSTSFANSSGGGFGNGTVVFEIAGTKLVGVLNRTLNRNLAIGG